MNQITVGNEVQSEGMKGIVESINGEFAVLTGHGGGNFCGYSLIDRTVKLSELAKTGTQKLADKYNMTANEVRSASVDFVQNEGYASDGTECQTLEKWLEVTNRKPAHKITEPWQKSDLGYGL